MHYSSAAAWLPRKPLHLPLPTPPPLTYFVLLRLGTRKLLFLPHPEERLELCRLTALVNLHHLDVARVVTLLDERLPEQVNNETQLNLAF